MVEAMSDRMGAVFSDGRITRAFQFLKDSEFRIEDDQIRITTIPAPPFGEESRGIAFANELRQIGLEPTVDAIGNVMAFYGEHGRNPVVVGAHLDTVFPIETPLQLRKTGRMLYLPGISDNGAGLVAVLWVLRAARECGLRFRRPVMAVANVGEEGEGNLRGVRHLFQAPPWPDRICDFIAVDGAGLHRITHQALGSRRFRILMKGPGGHSWADFGRPNPVHAIASAIHDFVAIGRRPGTSFNVGVIRGGISVNAIPTEAAIDVDLRAVSPENIESLQGHLRSCVKENARKVGVVVEITPTGDRPVGRTSADSELVQIALAATRRFGVDPVLDVGSTDANIPMSLGIPAIAIGAGGASGDVHTPREWFDPNHRELGLQRLLALIAGLAGIE
jgi:acetylornithine deacetylase/succinyl-diaminopimelate desuccinylase-like protein